MKIKQIKRDTPNFSRFMLKEWKLVFNELYHKKFDFSYWHTQHLYFEAIEGKKIVGGLIGEFFGGVFYIPELMVASVYRGKGVGELLLKQAEDWVRHHRGHEVYLFTGTSWRAKKFYLKVGYQVAANLPKLYAKEDFVLMRKFLD